MPTFLLLRPELAFLFVRSGDDAFLMTAIPFPLLLHSTPLASVGVHLLPLMRSIASGKLVQILLMLALAPPTSHKRTRCVQLLVILTELHPVLGAAQCNCLSHRPQGRRTVVLSWEGNQ